MIGLPSLYTLDRAQAARIWLATEATDMRCGFDRRGRYVPDKSSNRLIRLDKVCLLHTVSSKSGKRESHETKLSATLPS